MAKTFSDELRELIRTSGMTRYELSKRTGVGQDLLSRFMQGRDVTTATLDRLAPVLGLKITRSQSSTRPKKHR